MKNKFLMISILAGAFFVPAFCLGAIDYSRTPSGTTIKNPVRISFEADTPEELFPDDMPNYWTLDFQQEGFTNQGCLPIEILSYNQIFYDLPAGEYLSLELRGYGGYDWENAICLDAMATGIEFDTGGFEIISGSAGIGSYTRTPSGGNITSPVLVSVSIDNYEEIQWDNTEEIPYFSMHLDMGGESATEHGLGCYSSSTTSFFETYSLRPGQWSIGVFLTPFMDATCETAPPTGDSTYYLEGAGIYQIFKISTIPVVGGIVVMPGNALASTTEVVASTIGSVIILLELAIGVPLAFWVVKKWLALMP